MNPAIKQLENQASATLISLLDDMFASCDDLFFDLASRATSNLEQNLYFESMREIRIRTESCRNLYKKDLGILFESLGKPTTNEKETTEAYAEDLSLVREDDVELDVAAKSMTSRAHATTNKLLYEFHSRIESLYTNSIGQENNPLDPGSLTKLFINSSEDIDIEIKARIILLKQYERFVINRLPEIYLSANKLLEELGVKFVDDRKNTNTKQSGARLFNNPGNQQAEQDSGLLGDFGQSHYAYSSPALSELSNLLSRLRASSTLHSPQFSRAPLFSASDAPAIASQDLLDMLESSPQPDLNNSKNFDLRNYMRQLLKQSEKKDTKLGIEQVDEDIINLVAMFFDFVLDDHNIPDNMRALIGRLQMPVLKIALKDKSFFTNTEHTCRHFINEFSRISIGLADNDASSDELSEKMESWVQRIQNQTTEPEKAFDGALQELEEYSKTMQKRADLVEKRTSEGAQGQARKQVAKMKAQKAIQEAMDGKILAKPIADFIVNLWQQVLYRSHIHEGEESPIWLANLQTMQDLIWCSQPHSDEKSVKRLERIRSDLLDKLQTGLRSTTLNETQVTKLIKEINQSIDKVVSSNPESANIIEIEKFQADKETGLETLKEQKSWKEMSAMERQQKQHDALTYEYIERADGVPIGSWLEFKVPASGTSIRCKLAAKLEGSDIYVFVNRLGFKTLEKPRKEFAFDLQRKRARILKTGPLFDRSLHKMVSSLKSVNESNSGK